MGGNHGLRWSALKVAIRVRIPLGDGAAGEDADLRRVGGGGIVEREAGHKGGTVKPTPATVARPNVCRQVAPAGRRPRPTPTARAEAPNTRPVHRSGRRPERTAKQDEGEGGPTTQRTTAGRGRRDARSPSPVSGPTRAAGDRRQPLRISEHPLGREALRSDADVPSGPWSSNWVSPRPRHRRPRRPGAVGHGWPPLVSPVSRCSWACGSSRRSSSSTSASTRRYRPPPRPPLPPLPADPAPNRRPRPLHRRRRSTWPPARSCPWTTPPTATCACWSWPMGAASSGSRASRRRTGPICSSTCPPTSPTAPRAHSTTTT